MTNTTIVRNTHFLFCPTSVLVDTHSTIEGYVVWLSPALLLKTKREKCLLIYIDVSCTRGRSLVRLRLKRGNIS